MAIKTYVLLEHTKSTVPVFRRINKNQRVRMDTRIIDHAYLRTTFMTAASEGQESKNVTIRLRLTANTIFQDEQIKLGFGANDPFTAAERKAVEFNMGFLVVKNPIVQKYLETSPQMEGFKGESSEIAYPMYKIYDKGVEIKSENELIKKQAQAITRILSLNLKEGQDLMIEINGSFFTPPEEIEEVQNQLVNWMNSTDDKGLDLLLKKTRSKEEEMKILIGRAIDKGIISFDAFPDEVAKKINKQWVGVKTISSEMDRSQRLILFADFLLSEEGSPLVDDIQKALNK